MSRYTIMVVMKWGRWGNKPIKVWRSKHINLNLTQTQHTLNMHKLNLINRLIEIRSHSISSIFPHALSHWLITTRRPSLFLLCSLVRCIAVPDAEAVAGDSKTVGGLVTKSVQHSRYGVLLFSCLPSVPLSRRHPLWDESSLLKPSSTGQAVIGRVVFCRTSRHWPIVKYILLAFSQTYQHYPRLRLLRTRPHLFLPFWC